MLSERRGTLTVSVLIPAHNEEKSIRQCIISALGQSRPPDQVVIVNDGSVDKTKDIIQEFGFAVNVVELARQTGNKSYAQEYGMIFVDADIVIMTDADTLLDERFIENILPLFNDSKVAAVSGYVKSLKHNWLTGCREVEYVVGQQIHKIAQQYMGYFMIIPGCAAAFRTEIFREHITFDHDTVAEDLDFTYKLNERKLRIQYSRNAFVYTQDPADLKSYIYQVKRWYRGNWQNLAKHIVVLQRPMAAFELSLAFIEGLVFPLVLFFIFLINIFYFAKIILTVFSAVIIIFVFTAIIDRRKDLLVYPFHFLFIMFINSILFLTEFVHEIILRRREMHWFKPARREII